MSGHKEAGPDASLSVCYRHVDIGTGWQRSHRAGRRKRRKSCIKESSSNNKFNQTWVLWKTGYTDCFFILDIKYCLFQKRKYDAIYMYVYLLIEGLKIEGVTSGICLPEQIMKIHVILLNKHLETLDLRVIGY